MDDEQLVAINHVTLNNFPTSKPAFFIKKVLNKKIEDFKTMPAFHKITFSRKVSSLVHFHNSFLFAGFFAISIKIF